MILIEVTIVFITLFLFYHFYYKRRHLPPGPTPLPILGNVLSMMREPPGEDCFIRWSKKYGPVYTFWLGEDPVVFVTDYRLIVEHFQKDGEAYTGRMVFRELEMLIRGGLFGVIRTEGDLWREQRRFVLRVFRDFGVGKNMMQEKILDEISARFEKLDAEIESAAAGEVNIAATIDIAIGSIINSLLFNYRFDGDAERGFFELKLIVSWFLRRSGDFRFHFIRWRPHLFRHLPLFRSFFEHNYAGFQQLVGFFRPHIEARLRELAMNADERADEPSRDYVEAFLKEKALRDRLGVEHTFTLLQLEHMCADLWIAGQETTSTTLAWGVAFLIHNADAQRRMQAELDALRGGDDALAADRFITVADRPKLPYTCAVVNEIQRLVNLVPTNVIRRTTRDVRIGGYALSCGTFISPIISAVLYNEEVFTSSKQFRPERFLTETGELRHYDENIPFSIGKRQCLGESLARMEMFLFTANIFARYKISAGAELPSLQRRSGGTVQCLPFTCKVECRHSQSQK